MLNNATVCYWNAKKKAAIPNSSITFQEKFPTQVLIRCSEGFAKFKLTSRGLCEHAKKVRLLNHPAKQVIKLRFLFGLLFTIMILSLSPLAKSC